MKRTLLSTLAVALLLGTASRATAQDDEMKPILVVSIANYDTLIADVNAVGEASGTPDLGQALEAVLQLVTQGQGLVSLDKTRPWGALVQSDGVSTIQMLGFLPVTDLEKFLEVLSGIAQPEELDDGIWRLDLSAMPLPMATDLFFKQHGDWTYVSMGSEFLIDLPDDPRPLLSGLDEKYDFAGRVNFANIPEIFRQLLSEQLKIAVEQRFENMPLPGLDQLPEVEVSDEMELALQASEAQIEQLIDMLNETEHITFGVKLDPSTLKTMVDLEIQAIPDTETAIEMGTLVGQTSRFSGFYDPEAAVSAHASMVLSTEDIENVVGSVNTLREEAMSQLDGMELLSDEYIRSTLKGFVNDLFDLMEASARTGRIDTGLSLLGEGPYTLIHGGNVADGKDVTKLIDKFVDTLETEVGFYGFERNVAKVEDVTFHRVIAPIPGGAEADAFAEFFGDQLILVLGVGETSAYVGLGETALDSLKDAVAKSAENAEEKVPPMQMTARLGTVFEAVDLLATLGGASDDPNLAMIQDADAGEEDRVNVIMKPIENGVSFNLVGEAGLLKLIGTMGAALGANAGLPQF